MRRLIGASFILVLATGACVPDTSAQVAELETRVDELDDANASLKRSLKDLQTQLDQLSTSATGSASAARQVEGIRTQLETMARDERDQVNVVAELEDKLSHLCFTLDNWDYARFHFQSVTVPGTATVVTIQVPDSVGGAVYVGVRC